MTVPVPKATDQTNAAIVEGSPLAIIGIFVEYLRGRFTPPNNPPDYIWDNDPHAASIIIESAFDPAGDGKRGAKPAIYVDKNQSSYVKNALGDRAEHNFRTGGEGYWCTSKVPILIDCVAAHRGPSAIVGDIVQWSIHAASDEIQAAFGLHNMTPPTLGRTIPYYDDKTAFTTQVVFEIEHNLRWRTVQVAPILEEIRLRIGMSGASATDYFTYIATHFSEG